MCGTINRFQLNGQCNARLNRAKLSLKNLFTPLKNEYAKTACTAAVNKEQGILPKIVFCAMIILEKLMFIKTGHYRQKYSTNHTPRKSDILTSQYPQIFPTKTNQKLLQNILIFSI